MNLERLTLLIQWSGGALAFATLGIILYGIWRGAHRPAGRITGLAGAWLRSAWFYLASAGVFLAVGYCGWIAWPMTISPTLRGWMLALGSLLYFPSLVLVLWGRLALGRNYFVSTGFGAQLFAGHQLITTGPFAIVRHPMYVGLMLAALGSLLLYATWTTVFFACCVPFMSVRARREETVLAAEFGEQWRLYCQRVPAFIPRWRRS